MLRFRPGALTLVRAALLLAAATIASSASARVPQGFVGVTVGGPLYPITDHRLNLNHEFGVMVADGVESIRATFNWGAAQPYESWSQVPAARASQFINGPGGVPTTFAATDPLVAEAAEHGMSVLPVVLYSPSWDAVKTGSRVQPARDNPYGDYLTALIERYGPDGSFWSSNPTIPRRPIRAWEIWNEPDIDTYWSATRFERSYVALLKVAHQAIKRADPGAKVVLAGMPNYSWDYLKAIYQVRGARSSFDEVAVHPYTREPAGVITILGLVRTVMDRYGDRRKPLLVTEIGFPSALHQTRYNVGWKTSEAGQATKTGVLLRLLAANRRRLGLVSFDYETWMNVEYRNAPIFNFSGLIAFRRGKAIVKPALASFRHAALAMEGCRRKGATALICAQSG